MINLTDEQDHEILRTTEADGLFGGSYLDGQPLEQYLDGDEQPKYVLRNKKSGVNIEGGDQRSLEPATDFQAFALVTDLRVIFVVGQPGGDESLTLSLPDIVEVSTDSGLRTGTLSVETLDGQLWQFPCSGDPATVETYLQEAAQIWANAARLLDELEEALGSAEQELAAGDHETARERVDGARETIDTVIHRITEVGPGARKRIADRADELQTWLSDVERELRGDDAARAHAQAQSHWQHNEYEAAAASYDEAIEAYQQALDIEGKVPTTASLQRRLRGAAGERELLRIAPLVDADSARRRAVALADPEDAAGEWERALDLYRDLLSLDGDAFVVDAELIREQTTDIADDAISDHFEAGRQWLRSGDKLAVQERIKQAMQVYERAAEQFEHARRLASEASPDRLDSIEQAITATESRLDGEHPTETVPDDPIAFDPAAADDEDNTEAFEDDPADTDGIEGLAFHDSGSPATRPQQATTETANDREFETTGTDSPSVLDRIQAQKGANTASDERSASESTSSVETTDNEQSTTDQVSSEDLRSRLDTLDAAELREVVARLWEAEGWMTSVFDGTGQAVYDVVGMAGDTDDRVLLWTVPATDAPVDRTTIKQCTTTAEDSDTAIVVTTGSITSSAESEADASSVELVDGEALLERITDADLAGIVPVVETGDSPQT